MLRSQENCLFSKKETGVAAFPRPAAASPLEVAMNRPPDQEMIELKNLNLEKQLDLTRGPRGASERPVRLERANALRIAPGKVPELLSRVRQIRLLGGQSDPKLTEELGEGHIFKPCTQNQPTWCDLCGEFIWGMYKKCLQCVREYQQHVVDFAKLALAGGSGRNKGRMAEIDLKCGLIKL
uniref:Uncharacterized protein n=1 Tax=Sphaerodactylus townsendi TaxID=933632 RepID=A0ACB8EID7_9SAUR